VYLYRCIGGVGNKRQGHQRTGAMYVGGERDRMTGV